MIKDDFLNENISSNSLLYNQIVEILKDEIKFPHRIVSRKNRTYFYNDSNRAKPILLFKSRRLLVKITLLRSDVILEFNHRILTLDTTKYSSMIEMTLSDYSIRRMRDKRKVYMDCGINKSILNELKDLVNTIRIIDKNDGQSKKVNHRMNSLKSERVMSIKKEYESEICPTFSKPK